MDKTINLKMMIVNHIFRNMTMLIMITMKMIMLNKKNNMVKAIKMMIMMKQLMIIDD